MNAESGATLPQQQNETSQVVLISVYDNYSVKPELKTGWGFGTVVKMNNEVLLFDMGGDAEKLLFNMDRMGIDPQSVDKVFISHPHGDHTSGLKGFLDVNGHVTVYLPSSVPHSLRTMITEKGAEYVDVTEARMISESMYSTGEIYGTVTEQSLVILSGSGLIVMTGCAHPGIVKIVEKAKEMFPGEKVHLVLGGFHHPDISVVDGFRELGVQKVAPSHCTGDQVIKAFRKEYQEDFISYGVGQVIEN